MRWRIYDNGKQSSMMTGVNRGITQVSASKAGLNFFVFPVEITRPYPSSL
jgi:hypothetical protein